MKLITTLFAIIIMSLLPFSASAQWDRHDKRYDRSYKGPNVEQMMKDWALQMQLDDQQRQIDKLKKKQEMNRQRRLMNSIGKNRTLEEMLEDYLD